ncbi:MAG: flagellar hook-length control protein FliK, partial [Sulfuritalea sp.]|nr:flagellar hook-length control protein FliK [Sulfuritalea sp.]
ALALVTPRLGRIEADLRLSAAGVAIVLSASSPPSLDALRAAAPHLATALADAGVPLRGFRLTSENEHPAGQG